MEKSIGKDCQEVALSSQNGVVVGGVGKDGRGNAIVGGVGKDGASKAVLPSAIGFKISDLSDEQLYKKCVECGINAKEWIRKFAAMLPEVEKRGLYKKKGFVSLYDFAKKLAGMSEFTVDRILRLVKRLKDKPILLRQFESGKQSWNKIETVSYIATKETDKDLARKVEVLPYRALSAYVSQKRAEDDCVCTDELKNKTIFGQNLSGCDGQVEVVDGFRVGMDGNVDSGVQLDLSKMFDGVENAMINFRDSRQEERYKIFLFHASVEVQFKLRLFKQRLEKEQKQALSWNEVFEVLFQKLEERRREEEAKNVGKRGENVGKRGENVGKRDENVGKRDENVGKRGENVGKRDENVGKRDENVGKRGENVGKRGENVEGKRLVYNANRGKPGFVKYVKDENVVVKNNYSGKNLFEGNEDSEKIVVHKVGNEKDIKLDDKKLNNVPSRHIPVELKRQILAKYSYKCGFPKCNFPCFVLHHTKRFVLFRKHDAESIVPLCKKHHDLVHAGCIENEEDVPEKWVLKKNGEGVADGKNRVVEKSDKEIKGVADGKNRVVEKSDEEIKGVADGIGSGNVSGNAVDSGSKVVNENMVGASRKVVNGAEESIIVDKHTGEVLDTKEKIDAVVMKYKMKNVR